jgi:hypothetical protein
VVFPAFIFGTAAGLREVRVAVVAADFFTREALATDGLFLVLTIFFAADRLATADFLPAAAAFFAGVLDFGPDAGDFAFVLGLDLVALARAIISLPELARPTGSLVLGRAHYTNAARGFPEDSGRNLNENHEPHT